MMKRQKGGQKDRATAEQIIFGIIAIILTVFGICVPEKVCAAQGGRIILGITDEAVYSTWGEEPCGAAVPLIELLENELGLQTEVRYGTWTELRLALKQGQIDLLYGLPAVKAEASEAVPLWLSDMPVYCSDWLQKEDYYLVAVKGRESAISLHNVAGCIGTIKDAVLPDEVEDALTLHGQKAEYDTIQQMLTALLEGKTELALVPGSLLWHLYSCDELETIYRLPVQTQGLAVAATAPDRKDIILQINRYLEKDDEGALLREAIREEEWRYLTEYLKTSESILREMAEGEGFTLRYAWDGMEGSGYQSSDFQKPVGELAGFLEFFTKLTGIGFEQAEELCGLQAREALTEGDLDVVAGVVDSVGLSEDYCVTKPLWSNTLMAFLPAKSTGNHEKYDISHRYWGVTDLSYPMYENTAFDGHLVPFSNEREMLLALKKGEIGGIILRRSTAQDLIISGDISLLPVDGYELPVSEVMLLRGEQQELCTLWNRMYHYYRLQTSSQGQGAEENSFRELAVLLQQKQAQTMKIKILGAISVILFILCAVLFFMLYMKTIRLRRKETRLDYQEKYRREEREFLQLDRSIDEKMTQTYLPVKKEVKCDKVTDLPHEAVCRKRMKHILEHYPDTKAVLAYFYLDDIEDILHSYGNKAAEEMEISFAECLKTMEMNEETVVFCVSGDTYGAFRGNLQTDMDYRIFIGEIQNVSAQAHIDGELLMGSYRCGAAVSESLQMSLPRVEENAAAALQYVKKYGIRYAIWEDGNIHT